MSQIQRVHARQILDSRGSPTVEVEVGLRSGAHGHAGAGGQGVAGPARATGPAPEQVEEIGPTHAPTLGEAVEDRQGRCGPWRRDPWPSAQPVAPRRDAAAGRVAVW